MPNEGFCQVYTFASDRRHVRDHAQSVPAREWAYWTVVVVLDWASECDRTHFVHVSSVSKVRC